MSWLEEKKARKSAVLESAKSLALKAKSESRGLSAAEQKIVDDALAECETINTEIKSATEEDNRSGDILGQLDAMAQGRDSGPGSGKTEYLSFSKSWGSKAVDKLMPNSREKALAAGSSVFVATELTTTPIPMGRPATSLLDLLPVVRHGQPAYSYIRQSVRTNAAAVVVEGTTKPTSTYTIVKVDGSLSVVAHLSEPLHRYWFEDAASLRPFLVDELAYGIGLAVETKVLADINGTSGVQTQTFATNALTTLRKCLTKLENQGCVASAMVVHPNDWEAIELALSSTTAVEYRGLPYDPVARRLFGVPVVVATAQAAGVAHVIATGAVAVDSDTQGVLLQWTGTHGTDFAENKVRALMEGRFGTSVFTPWGVVKADLTAD